MGTVDNGNAIDTASVGAIPSGNVGHSATVTHTRMVVCNFNMHSQPVDDLPALNIAFVGSSIPVKFSPAAISVWQTL